MSHHPYLSDMRTNKMTDSMVWATVTTESRSTLVFINYGVEINAEHYLKKVSKGALKPWVTKYYGKKSWKFQQDSALYYKGNEAQQWLENNVPRFISASQWTNGQWINWPLENHNRCRRWSYRINRNIFLNWMSLRTLFCIFNKTEKNDKFTAFYIYIFFLLALYIKNNKYASVK